MTAAAPDFAAAASRLASVTKVTSLPPAASAGWMPAILPCSSASAPSAFAPSRAANSAIVMFI
ncbi:MAG: hypothetical protein A2Y77_05270 [Planctomycetes bacterium RBG_13_62_9]|nr:MAG: hypothetical protein A2Y77_05270 [Planctomycetes bacterium RBG_13_62_9]